MQVKEQLVHLDGDELPENSEQDGPEWNPGKLAIHPTWPHRFLLGTLGAEECI